MPYATPSEFKTYRGIADAGDDALITQLLARAQGQIEEYCGREFEAPTDSTRYFDGNGPHIEGPALHVGWFGDLCSITTVTNGDGTVITSGLYTTYPKTLTAREPVYSRIVLLASGGAYWTYDDDPENAIAITGKWAYTAGAPADIKHACIRLAAYQYAQKDAPIFDVTAIPGTGEILLPQGIPADVRMILDRYKRPFWALSQM